MADPYDVLGVPRDSDPEAVREAFGRLSRRIPPERRAADPDAAAAFARIAAAYASLTDPAALERRAAFEAWGRGGPELQGPPPRREPSAPRAAGREAAAEESVELKPGEEFSLRRLKGRLLVWAGLVMAARGAIGVYLDPNGLPARLARHIPVIGDLERDPSFVVMLLGMAAVVRGAGSFMVTDREAEAMDQMAGRRRLFRRVRWFP